MATDERVSRAVFSAVDELNAQLPAGVSVEKSLDAPLYGAGGKLESLDFVTLIMEVELLSKAKSPFSTLRTLIEYLEELLKQPADSA